MTWFSASPLPGATFFSASGPNSIEAILNDLSGQAQLQNFRNIVGRNGQFAVWQRGTSIAVPASTTSYTADGWYLQTGATEAHTVSQSSTSNSIGTVIFAAAIERNNGQSGTSQVYFEFPLDSDEIIKLRGQKVILTFFAAGGGGGANGFSGGSGASVAANLYVGTGSPAKRAGSPYTGETQVINFSNTIGANNLWAQYTSAVSAVVPTNVGQAALQFTWNPSGTAGTGDILYLAGVHLQAVSPNLTPIVPVFELTDVIWDYQRCLRFFQKSFPLLTAPAASAAQAGCLQYVNQSTAALGYAMLQYAVPMRTTPAMTYYSPAIAGATWVDLSASPSPTSSGAAVPINGNEKTLLLANASALATLSHVGGIHWTASAEI